MRTGQPYSIEHRIFRGSSDDRIIDHHGQALFDGKQQAERIIGTVRDITDQRQAQAKIHRLAYFDALTGLPNRLMLREHLEEILPQTRVANQTAALISIDLDQFKRVNDSIGHQVGDELLLEVSHRLRVTTRSEGLTKHRTLRRDQDFIARVGEDGFSVMMLVDGSDLSSFGRAAERLLDVIRRPIELNGQAIYCTASLGIAIGRQDGANAEALIKNADAAMFHAKSVGRNGYQFYAASISKAATDELTLESDMRHALENNLFYLVYQP